MSRATLLDRSGKVTGALDVRRGEPVEKQLDDYLHRKAGKVLAEWWVLGNKIRGRHGARDSWCINLVQGGEMPIQVDIRKHFLKDCRHLGIRIICHYLKVADDGSSVLEPGALTMRGLTAIGRSWQGWNLSKRHLGITVRWPDKVDGTPGASQSLSLWVVLNQLLRQFEADRAAIIQRERDQAEAA